MFLGALGKEKRAIDLPFETEECRRLVTSFHARKDNAKVRVVDAAFCMKGCSSLGRLRYAVLLRIGNGGYKNGGLCLIDIKEATKAVAPRAASSSMPRNNAKRVVEGACNLSPFLGKRMLATKLFGPRGFHPELDAARLKTGAGSIDS